MSWSSCSSLSLACSVGVEWKVLVIDSPPIELTALTSAALSSPVATSRRAKMCCSCSCPFSLSSFSGGAGGDAAEESVARMQSTATSPAAASCLAPSPTHAADPKASGGQKRWPEGRSGGAEVAGPKVVRARVLKRKFGQDKPFPKVADKVYDIVRFSSSKRLKVAVDEPDMQAYKRIKLAPGSMLAF